jgi:phosphatidylglycerol:prolipoprotein diacylglycerol transferase
MGCAKSMIPYLPQPVLEIAGKKFYAFGALVAVALLVGCGVFLRRVHRQQLDPQFARLFIVAVAGVGYFASYALKMLIFAPLRLLSEPLAVVGAAPGIYSFGGLVGGLVTAAWLMHKYQISPQDRWRYLDNLAFAFTCGWIFGRAGCSLAHDHIGIPSSSALAVQFPGGPRYDLGLLEFIFTVSLAVLFFFLDRRRRPAGLFLGLFFITYGLFRIWRDTLEVPKAGLWGVSPDRLFAIACVLAGGIILAMLFPTRVYSAARK